MKNKKAQLKIQEMMFMLLGVFLFLILASLFALSIMYSNLQKSVNQINEDKSFSSVINLANSPEFMCTTKSNCIDEDRLLGLMKNSNYRNFFAFSSLMIVKENGFGKDETDMIKCTDANYPNCDLFVIYDLGKEERSVSSFVALCRKESENGYAYDRCEIGKIIAGSEVKG